MNDTTNIRIISIDFAQAGRYLPQYRRPYVANISTEALENGYAFVGKLRAERALLRTGVNLDPEDINLADLSREFIDVNTKAQPVNLAYECGGWEKEVATFVIEVEYIHQAMPPTKVCIAGYTDRPVPLDGSPFDPEMRMIVNSIHTARSFKETTAEGTKDKIVPMTAEHVLTNPYHSGLDNNPLSRMRPRDTILTLSRLNDPMLVSSGVTVVDTRTTLNSTPTFSSYTDSEPTVWMEELMIALVNAEKTIQETGESGPSHRKWHIAASAVNYVEAHRDYFLKVISRVSQTVLTNNFKFSDLALVHPDMPGPHVVMIARPTNSENVYSSWEGNARKTQVAYRLANSIPAILAKHGIRSLNLTAHNTASPTLVAIQGSSGVFDYVDGETLHKVAEEIKTRVLLPISSNDQALFTLDGRFDIFGSSIFSLSLDNEASSRYAYPSFASAMLAPVITSNKLQLEEVASSINLLLMG